VIPGRLAIYAVAALAGAGAVAGLWWHGHIHGMRACEQAHAEAAREARQTQARLADELSEVRRERDRVASERVRIIYREADTVGCADVPALGSVLDGLGAGDRPEAD
jgi:hypothetical protein